MYFNIMSLTKQMTSKPQRTLGSVISVALRLLIFGIFSWGYSLIKGYLCLFKGGTFILLPDFFQGVHLFKGGMVIPDLRVEGPLGMVVQLELK